MNKILLTLLVISVCVCDAVSNYGSLLEYFFKPAPRAFSPPPSPSLRYNSYYQQPAPSNSRYVPYYHQTQPMQAFSPYAQPQYMASPRIVPGVQPVRYMPLSSPPVFDQVPSVMKSEHYIAPVDSYSIKYDQSSPDGQYSIETVKSEGHSYSLEPEQITIENIISPVKDMEPFIDPRLQEPEPSDQDAPGSFVLSQLTNPTAVTDNEEALPHQLSIPTNDFATTTEAPTLTATAAPPATITVQSVNKVSPRVVQPAIPLAVNRIVPQQQQQQPIQQPGEQIQIVTPVNFNARLPDPEEKVYVMYATSVGQQPNDSENLVIPSSTNFESQSVSIERASTTVVM
ncbi:uncharacterized protein LOC129717480 [Wyeomyia smithii]|uniref:uncharacterized protein LOC129717480 n=1 Tax=Wyeomyia smithii TaxID=174621 RepID=UPI0024680931|nr:uncharacterized protein LOC129717480 [Wyeomyia smithii]